MRQGYERGDSEIRKGLPNPWPALHLGYMHGGLPQVPNGNKYEVHRDNADWHTQALVASTSEWDALGAK